jgi:hypothetical protein
MRKGSGETAGFPGGLQGRSPCRDHGPDTPGAPIRFDSAAKPWYHWIRKA